MMEIEREGTEYRGRVTFTMPECDACRSGDADAAYYPCDEHRPAYEAERDRLEQEFAERVQRDVIERNAPKISKRFHP